MVFYINMFHKIGCGSNVLYGTNVWLWYDISLTKRTTTTTTRWKKNAERWICVMTDIEALCSPRRCLVVPCTSVLGVRCVGSVLFFFFVVVHSTQCSHSSESINQLRSARVCMCACVYAVERIVDDGTHYLPPCQFLIFNVFTTTDNILYHIQWHPVPLPTIIVPSTIPIFVLNTPIPCIGIDSVLRQLNIQLSQTVYGFRRAANRLQSASVQVCLCAQCVSDILTHSCTLCANQFDASRFRRNANRHCLFMQWASCGKSGEPEVIVAFQTKWKMKILVSFSRSHLKCDRCCYVPI